MTDGARSSFSHSSNQMVLLALELTGNAATSPSVTYTLQRAVRYSKATLRAVDLHAPSPGLSHSWTAAIDEQAYWSLMRGFLGTELRNGRAAPCSFKIHRNASSSKWNWRIWIC